MNNLNYLVVLTKSDGNDVIHSEYKSGAKALKAMYKIKLHYEAVRIEYSDYAARKHDCLNLSKFGLELIMGLFSRIYSEGTSTYENEKALDELAGVINELTELHIESMSAEQAVDHLESLDKLQHEIDALIR
jgi:hypothetical protein